MASDIGETHPKYFPRTEIENRDGNGNGNRDIANDKGASLRRMESFEINGSESFASQVDSTYVRVFVHVCLFVHVRVIVHVCVSVHVCVTVHVFCVCACTCVCAYPCVYGVFGSMLFI